MTPLPPDLLDHLAAVGNRALSDHYHDDLCGCSPWPNSCVSRYNASGWDTSAFDIALPAITAAYEKAKAQQ
ncbi:hypothetical protein ACGFZP_13005 [Kitasatospora sp. NPDC048239]|uniref:hypothetical protein n=1 Tax=Kitasatospora sp. NPDC048239 TaxID=3364046 RepID=UPI003712BFD6